MPLARDRRIWAMVAAAAGAVVVLAAIGLPLLLDGPEAEGGAVLSQSSDHLTVRCLSPEVVLTLNGFRGGVTFTNCFPNSTLLDFPGTVTREGSNLSCDVGRDVDELRLVTQTKEVFRFAVMGDSQGQNGILAEALAQTDGCEFVIHCGDTTPSGQSSEFDAFEETLGTVSVPVMVTPGNHDIKLDGGQEYRLRFGESAYTFDYSGIRFAFVDSSDQIVSEEEIEWLREAFQGAERKVLVTHMPSYDPFGNNHTLDAPSCERVQDFTLDEDIDLVLTGHVHAYHHMRVESTDLIITGGAGGALVDGVHHLVIVTVNDAGFSFEKVDLEYVPPSSPYVQIVGKDGFSLNLTYEELMSMDLAEGDSSYENLFGNIQGQGYYRGVLVRELIDMVGGMAEGDLLTVTSSDGYLQEFGYRNAYPDAAWLSLQGEMVVALEMDGVLAPVWTEGPRLAMLPEDGLYSNSDCDLTSYEGQGYDVYESAGARWVKNLLLITVEAPS